MDALDVEWARLFKDKPIIGIAGGIGSGKSFVAKLFGQLGCLVISSDEQVAEAYRDPEVRQVLREWWQDRAFKADGSIDRRFVASQIFSDVDARRRLEGLIHPWVLQARDRVMEAAVDDPQVKAFVWDTPLLFEADLHKQCDAVVFVDSPQELRRRRVGENRGWDEAELARREFSQWPLDRKREISDYVISNTADAGFARNQVRQVLSRILATRQ